MVKNHVLQWFRKEIELATLRHTGELDDHLISRRFQREGVSRRAGFRCGRCVFSEQAFITRALPTIIQFQRNLSVTRNTSLFGNEPLSFGPEINRTSW